MDIPLPLPLILDGATGTALQRRGMPRGACTEDWVLQHPEVLQQLQREYLDAGAQILLAPTFGANRVSLARHGLQDRTEEMNKTLIALTRAVAGERALVAADLAPTGLHVPPYGETPFEELIDVYTQQARACEEAGCDLFVMETATTLPEARAAVLAVRSVSDKPIWVTFTCDGEGRTLLGTDVLAAMIVMQGMGVSAFGLNCCEGPEEMAEIFERLAPYATVPLIAKPNAGLPQFAEGSARYDCTPAEFASYVSPLAAAGVRVFGGCCGTESGHIAALKQAVDGVDFAAIPAPRPDEEAIPCASEKEAHFIWADMDMGETVECSPDLLEDILDAEDEGSALKLSILDMDDVDVFVENQYAIEDVLCLYCDVPEVLEAALRAYHGRAVWDGTGDIDPDFLQEMSRKYGLILL